MHEMSTVPGERVLVDISTIKPLKRIQGIPRDHWRIVVDECTNFKVSHFLQKKDQMAEAPCELLRKWKDLGIIIKYIRMDNTGKMDCWK